MPAVRLARDGFAVDEALAESLNGGAASESPQFAELQRVFAPPGGDKCGRPAIGWCSRTWRRTLEQIADDGPDAFYRGPIADQIVAEMKAGGGLITKEDLAAYQANVREPIHGTYRGYDVYRPAAAVERRHLPGRDAQHPGELRPHGRGPAPPRASAAALVGPHDAPGDRGDAAGLLRSRPLARATPTSSPFPPT